MLQLFKFSVTIAGADSWIGTAIAHSKDTAKATVLAQVPAGTEARIKYLGAEPANDRRLKVRRMADRVAFQIEYPSGDERRIGSSRRTTAEASAAAAAYCEAKGRKA